MVDTDKTKVEDIKGKSKTRWPQERDKGCTLPKGCWKVWGRRKKPQQPIRRRLSKCHLVAQKKTRSIAICGAYTLYVSYKFY